MAADRHSVSQETLAWAIARAGYRAVDLARKYPDLSAWLDGTKSPTYRQVDALSQTLSLPIAILFMRTPPTLPDPRPLYRSLSITGPEVVGPALARQLHRAQLFQNAIRAIYPDRDCKLTSDGPTLFDADTDIVEAAASLRIFLGVSEEERLNWPRSSDNALKRWRERLEYSDIQVFKSAFHDQDIAGFCIHDLRHPLIYVNNSQPKTRQIFTLFHETCHLILGYSGVDQVEEGRIPERRAYQKLERFCDAFAAEFLAPRSLVERMIDSENSYAENAETIGSRLNISREVILGQFVSIGTLTWGNYHVIIDRWRSDPGKDSKSKGGSFYNNQLAYLGRQYISDVLNAHRRANIDGDEAARFLGIAPRLVDRLAANVEGHVDVRD